jgi:predicted alpha-1,2-mannosidase
MSIKNVFLLIFAIPLFLSLTSCEKRVQNDNQIFDYLQYVDPMIGTDGHGHTYPGATMPFGLVQVSPDNGISGWDWVSGYHYSANRIVGFSHTHLSGTGVGDMLDVLILPAAEAVHHNPNDTLPMTFESHYATYSHENESASAGYYSVLLDEPQIKVELTASTRAGFHKYSFPSRDSCSVLIDLGLGVNTDSVTSSHIKIISDTLVTGFRYSTGWAKNQKTFFAIRFSKPLISYDLISSDSIYFDASTSIEGQHVKGIVRFIPDADNQLMLKVGISAVSEENALININHELPDWNFNSARGKTQDAWNKALNKIKITSKSQKLLRTFYTALYHSMLSPNVFSDSIENNTFEYRSPDDLIYTDTAFTNYHTFSLWDTYRAAHPLYTIIQKDRVQNFIRSMLAHYRDTGQLPVWSLWGNETGTMIGYHAVPVIYDAYKKGLLPDLPPDSLYAAMKASAFQNTRETPLYIEYGYIPADTLNNTVSKTLEYAFDDWCIAQMAKDLNQMDEHYYFMERAGYYKNVFDRNTLFMRAKLANGQWKEPFDPLDTKYRNDYTEGNAWQYTWYVPHAIPELIQMMGGPEIFEKKLDSLFIIGSDMGSEAALDVSGMIGQYVHGNEPSHHIVYLYNYINKPWKTQEKITEIMNTLYGDDPAGLCGNEDCGQMSAWYIFNALGFYPVNPANGRYDLGIPLFERLEIDLPGLNSFIIQKKNDAPENKYVKTVTLNGETLNELFITHEQIMNGGILEFEMTDQIPN